MGSLLMCLFIVSCAVGCSAMAASRQLTRIGCYADEEKEFMFTFNAGDQNSPQYCADYCGSRAYKYAALQSGSLCSCGNAYGRHGKVPETNCITPCPSDDSLMCGGLLNNEVFETGVYRSISNGLHNDIIRETLKPMEDDGHVHRFGCFKESSDSNKKDLPLFLYGGDLTSPQYCLNRCRSMAYRFAGLQDGTLCICLNSYELSGRLDDSQCTVKCMGDASVTCGDDKMREIFSTGIYPPGSILNKIPNRLFRVSMGLMEGDGRVQRYGCFRDKDSSQRDLPVLLYGGDLTSPQYCVDRCRSMSYRFAGLQDGKLCTCGNSYGRHKRLHDNQCNVKCMGDATVTCGARMKNEIFSTGIYPSGSILNKVLNDNFIKTLHQIESDGRVQRLGCYEDKVETERDLPLLLKIGKLISPFSCVHRCRSMAYKFAGLQDGKLCTCGNSYGRYRRLDDSQCNVKCMGDASVTCGGAVKNEVFSTGINPSGSILNNALNDNFIKTLQWIELLAQRIGCYEDKHDRERDLPFMRNNRQRNTPKDCVDLCYSKNFKFAGLQDGVECHCGDSYGRHRTVDDSECNKKCPGDSSVHVTCGGYWRNEIYSTGIDFSGLPKETPVKNYFNKIVGPMENDGRVQRLGCYREKHGSERDLPLMLFGGNQTSPQVCVDRCRSRAYKFAGLLAGFWCQCGNSYGRHGRVDDSECNTRCRAEASVTCGGASSHEIFSTGINPLGWIANRPENQPLRETLHRMESDGRVQRLGCHNDNDFKYDSLSPYDDASPQICVRLCREMAYKFACMRNGTRCLCGNSYEPQRRLDDSECNVPCIEDAGATCGAAMKSEVFSVGIKSKCE